MTHKDFTYRELLAFGWEKTKEHYWFLLGVAFLFLVISGATMIFPIINSIVSLLLTVAVISVTFVIVDGHVPKFHDMLKPFATYKVAWHAILATLLSLVIIIVGFLLLILPGIYLATRLKFYLYALIEHENMGVTDSLRRSMELTKGLFWKLFGWNLLIALINIAGLLAFGIGLLFTVPTTVIAYTYLYRKLSPKHAPVPHEHHESPHIAAV
jgi:uncharacterized membrane protein